MKHTPGPWTITELIDRHDITHSHIEATKGWANSGMANKRTVAIVGHWKDRPNPEHDAQLISKSPQMYEAIKGLLAVYDPVKAHAPILMAIDDLKQSIKELTK